MCIWHMLCCHASCIKVRQKKKQNCEGSEKMYKFEGFDMKRVKFDR
jgi:hypothetical protein